MLGIVADHPATSAKSRPAPFGGQLENPDIRLADTDFTGDAAGVHPLTQTRALDLRQLVVSHPIAHHAHPPARSPQLRQTLQHLRLASNQVRHPGTEPGPQLPSALRQPEVFPHLTKELITSPEALPVRGDQPAHRLAPEPSVVGELHCPRR
ncbi:hypothetical protein M8J74_05535 [Streptomyces panaciradicis]|nr:hypothetical protein [Streptomyces panaciradicis]MCL6667890.1 hypothetical protein [Streptomyces panaciradicis]